MVAMAMLALDFPRVMDELKALEIHETRINGCCDWCKMVKERTRMFSRVS